MARPTIVVPGNHDGVHRGHQALLDRARGLVGEDGIVTALFFTPHPLVTLAPERAPTPLTTPERRRELLVAAGVDRALAKTFDADFAAMSPEAFVRGVLLDQLEGTAVMVGPDFRFGHRREGDIERLRQLGEQFGLAVHVATAEMHGPTRISSSRIRRVIAEGDVALARELLGRIHDVEGTVVQGQARGRTLGFPTANLEGVDTALPADGVYAVVCREVGTEAVRQGVANLGVRPTVDAGRSFEVHLLDFGGDLYGQRLRVGFVERLRGEQRFGNLDELKAQITRDCLDARRLLGQSHQGTSPWD
ncbi:MAG: bifunctional riboflavin kinase/FAD synthetase [Myxococcales bacterium]|nr:bifunctional riboflavin kinase/FAD synthetase [Myxococcales bacterium]